MEDASRQPSRDTLPMNVEEPQQAAEGESVSGCHQGHEEERRDTGHNTIFGDSFMPVRFYGFMGKEEGEGEGEREGEEETDLHVQPPQAQQPDPRRQQQPLQVQTLAMQHAQRVTSGATTGMPSVNRPQPSSRTSPGYREANFETRTAQVKLKDSPPQQGHARQGHARQGCQDPLDAQFDFGFLDITFNNSAGPTAEAIERVI